MTTTQSAVLAEVTDPAELADRPSHRLWHYQRIATAVLADGPTDAARQHAARLLDWLQAELAARALHAAVQADLATARQLVADAEAVGVNRHVTGAAYDQLEDADRLLRRGRDYADGAGHLIAETRQALEIELADLAGQA